MSSTTLGAIYTEICVTVLGEAISNSWDADAQNVWIDIDRENSSFSIKDDGKGMSSDDFQNKFLRIGYSKRKDGKRLSDRQRPFIGAKGIGKLALLSCANRISIFTKTANTDYVGGAIDNDDLDQAITDDLTPQQYALEPLDSSLVGDLMTNHPQGTILIFQNMKEQMKKLGSIYQENSGDEFQVFAVGLRIHDPCEWQASHH